MKYGALPFDNSAAVISFVINMLTCNTCVTYHPACIVYYIISDPLSDMTRWGCTLHVITMVISDHVTITIVPVAKLTSSTGKTPKTKPSKLSTSAVTHKGTYITKTTKKIKLDSYLTPPPAVKSTPRKKTSVGGVIRTLSTPSSLTKVIIIELFKYFIVIFLV